MDLKVLELPLKVLKISGLDPRVNNSWFAKIMCMLSFVISIIIFIATLMEMYQGEWNIVSVILEVETIVAVIEVTKERNIKHTY